MKSFSQHSTDTSRFLPDADRDIFLVTYPRSGTTWISCLAAELMFSVSPQSLTELDSVIPDIHVPVEQSSVPAANQYLVKSHLPFTGTSPYGEYRRIIYLIRDPRDVMLSYHRFFRVQHDYEGDLRAFAKDWACGRIWPGSWQDHVNSWLGPAGALLHFSPDLLRYEEFIDDPVGAAARLAQLLGVDAPRSRIEQVVANSHPDKMRKRERSGNAGARPGLEFIGPATSGVWKKQFERNTQEAIATLEEYARYTMQKMGYEPAYWKPDASF